MGVCVDECNDNGNAKFFYLMRVIIEHCERFEIYIQPSVKHGLSYTMYKHMKTTSK